ncbi:MAG: VUT family protein [Rickettsiales bacterium]|nr:VUT family protein [Rickettsiales bacterium]
MISAIKSIVKSRWAWIYILTIPAVNLYFAYLPFIQLPDGGQWAPVSVVTGLILVFRDFTQRDIGHHVLIALAIGLGITIAMAGPAIALASGTAFLVSELVDWAIYSFTKKPLSERIMLSSLVAAPLDTTVFLLGADMVRPGTFAYSTLICSVASKLFGAYIVYRMVKARETGTSFWNLSQPKKATYG